MKLLIPLILLLVLTGCSTHSVKLGKKCTKLAEDNTYEKSFVWIINNKNLENFDQNIDEVLIYSLFNLIDNDLSLIHISEPTRPY